MIWTFLKQQALVAHLLDNHQKLAARINDFGPLVLCGNSMILFLRGYEFSSPAILQGPLHEAFGHSTLVNLAYFLAGAALSPMLRELVMLCDLKWLGVASCLCSLLGSCLAGTAQRIEVFLLGRIIMSVGSVSLHQMQVLPSQPIYRPRLIPNRALSYNAHQAPAGRPTLQGIIWTFFALGFFSGPLIAAALSEHLTWKWAFLIMMPLCAATMLLFALAYPHLNLAQESQGASLAVASRIQEHSDLIGDSLWIILMFLIFWACTESRLDKPKTMTILAWLLFGSFLAIFAFQQFSRRRGRRYSIFSIFFHRERCLTLSFLSTTLASLGYGSTIFQATVFATGSGLSMTETAISLMALLGPMVATTILSGYLLVKTPYPYVFVFGSLLIIGGSCIQQSVDASGKLFLLSLAEAAAGFGFIWQAALPMSYVMIRSKDEFLPHGLRTSAVSIFNVAQMGGISVSMAIMEPLLGISPAPRAWVLRRSAYLTTAAGSLGFLAALCMKFRGLSIRKRTCESPSSQREKTMENDHEF